MLPPWSIGGWHYTLKGCLNQQNCFHKEFLYRGSFSLDYLCWSLTIKFCSMAWRRSAAAETESQLKE